MIIKDAPRFTSINDELAWLIKNQDELIMEAKMMVKEADGVLYLGHSSPEYVAITGKSASEDTEAALKRSLIINTTNIYDSHKDVHFNGIWNKSVSENKNIKFLQEHQMRFDKIIAHKDDLKAYVKEFTWKDLGFDFEGKTEALTFDAIIKAARNPYMFNMYKEDEVDNHSVGMNYQKVQLAINKADDEDYAAQKAVWDKYFPMIANKNAVGAYFWAVTEAKVIEGSAVPIGSNQYTPTRSRSKHSEIIITPEPQNALTKGIMNFLKN